ncbi:glycosyltransferase family 4 protein [Singulisphaera sp. Ch08]|uniref:Glycosyltransferase family 4 protein n=1 Tax=Singulisphaera sp. Ch08 TaxID=3120278 RepID=A0AAU7CM44_9BACT
MRILILSQWFQPEPMLKGLPLAKALRDRGHEVEVLTGFPNYPGGKLYPGYRVRPMRREMMDGIRVNRVALYPSHGTSGLGRLLNYLSFGASAGLIGPWLVRKPDVVYVYNLITLGFAARLLRWFRGSKTVLDVQDLWPESVAGSGMVRNRTILGLLNRWCCAVYRRSDRLMVNSPGFKRNLVARGVDEDKIEVIYNWYDQSEAELPPPDPNLARELGFNGRFNIVFAGTMGLLQALDPVIECARRLSDRRPDVFFTFVGGGVEVDRLKALAGDLSNVQFLARRPPSAMSEIYSLADALLVHLKLDPLFAITIPSKIQAYLCAGKPILCGVPGDAADLVGRAQAGVDFLPEDSQSLEQAILRLLAMEPAERRQLGANGRAYYQEHLSVLEGVRRIESVFADAVATP